MGRLTGQSRHQREARRTSRTDGWPVGKFYNTHRPHRTLNQAAPLRPLPDGVTDLDHFRVRRRDRAGGVIHEYRLVA
jgi:hypothetical protein